MVPSLLSSASFLVVPTASSSFPLHLKKIVPSAPAGAGVAVTAVVIIVNFTGNHFSGRVGDQIGKVAGQVWPLKRSNKCCLLPSRCFQNLVKGFLKKASFNLHHIYFSRPKLAN